jgi:putative mycofactocin binding protein MftB
VSTEALSTEALSTEALSTEALSTEALSAAASGNGFDASLPYELHPDVGLRREAFGAIAYHYGSRRLTFLKSVSLVDLLEALPRYGSARACVEAHAGPSKSEALERALSGLATSGVIRAR